MKVTTRYGEFSVFAESDLISRSLLLYGEWAQCEINALGQFISRGDAVVDAGAFIGTHTVAFSLMVGSQGTVHSFEPNGRAKELLLNNVFTNAIQNVTIHERALGEARSRAMLETFDNQNLGATRIHPLGKAAKKSITIKTLDSFKLKKVDFIKADVEGWEMSLVRGASATIGSFRPTIFLECNSLQAVSELPAWLRENEYISYGLLVDAYNPRNFNDCRENIFGPSKECGLLLIPKERASSLSMPIQTLNLPLLATIDDVALLLLHKPQYPYEILEKSISANVVGINYPSPALRNARNSFEIEERDLNAELLELRGQLGTVRQSLERDYSAKMTDRESNTEKTIQAMTARVSSLTEAMQSLQQEMQLQRASFYKKALETNQAHVALEKELQEELLLTQLELQAVEQDRAVLTAAHKTEAELKAQALAMLDAIQRDWAAKMTVQQVEAERKTHLLVTQVESLTQTVHSIQQETLLQRASFHKRAQEAHRAHVALERELQEELLSAQQDIEALERDWSTKMTDQQLESTRTLQMIEGQVTSLTQSLLQAEEDRRRQQVAYTELALSASKVQEELEGNLRDNLLSAQRQMKILEEASEAKVADMQAEFERTLKLMTSQIDALTKSLLEAQEELRRQQTAHLEETIEVSSRHSEVELDLRDRLLAAQMNVEGLEQAKNKLETEKAKVEASIFWRTFEGVRKTAGAVFGNFVLSKKTNPIPSSLEDTNRNAPKHTGEADLIDNAHDRETQEIIQSGLFDREFYLSTYADVASANIDPLSHYMNYGWKEGRNPSESFETGFYLETYLDVKESNLNPLTHYVRFGQNEERKKASIEMLSDISLYFDLIDRQQHVPKIASIWAIDIVIPIYNGFDYLEPLFSSIFSHTSTPYRLIVIDDASPDIRVKTFLRELTRKKEEADILLIENAENLGFVRSVNKAVAEVRNHFVLLNSDTELPPNWLERLMFPILEMDNVASTTPFTNSGTICSFPLYLKDNPLFGDLSPEVIDSYFQLVKFESNYLQIPTGIGFCMGVNKRVVDEIGMFDECFGKGYCEENDWCARAEKLGYRNLQVLNLFVYHKHGGSFPSEERKRLLERNYSILLEKHPSYDTRVQDAIRLNSLKDLRQFLLMLISSNEFGAVLIFDNELGGGAHQFRKARSKQFVEDGEAVFLISYKSNKDKIATLEFHFKSYNFSLSVRHPSDLVNFFHSIKIREIIVNSFVSFPNVKDWIELTGKIRGIRACRLIFLAHDYFSVCPSYTLINESNEYCGVPGDLEICRECLVRNTGDFKRFEAHSNIVAWRTQWEAFLRDCDEIVCFGNSSADILRRAYPSIDRNKIVVRPHDISGRFRQIYFAAEKNKVRNTVSNIGVLGAINLAKGSHVLRDLVEYIDSRRLPVKVILFGEIDVEIRSKSFEATGRYVFEHLESSILERNIDVFVLPSIWPETFSYTADEIMQMGFPLIAFDIGAPAERVRGYPLGKVIDQRDLYSVLFGDHSSAKVA